MIKVYVAGPISEDPNNPAPKERQLEHVRLAIVVGERLFQEGYAPYIPHLDVFWQNQLRVEHTWEMSLAADEEWVASCDAVLRIPGPSVGADRECALAKKLGIPVYYGEDAFFADPPLAPHPSSKKFYDHLRTLALTHAKKQRDYGRDDDPFANVRASEEWGVASYIGAWIRMNDKIRRLQTFAQKGSLANEGVADSLIDIAVYSIISLVLFEEEQEEAYQTKVRADIGDAAGWTVETTGTVNTDPTTWTTRNPLYPHGVAPPFRFGTPGFEDDTLIGTHIDSTQDALDEADELVGVDFSEGGDASSHTFHRSDETSLTLDGAIRSLRENSTT